MLGPLGNLASSVFGPLGGVVGKILPIVGVITTIITVIQLVKNSEVKRWQFLTRL